jgi:hypothetical protein
LENDVHDKEGIVVAISSERKDLIALLISCDFVAIVQQAAQQLHSHTLQSSRLDYHFMDHLLLLKQILILEYDNEISTLMDGLHAEYETDEVRYRHDVFREFKTTLIH